MYDEHETKAILQRAIELDAFRRAGMTRDELVQVAAEVGVSAVAVDQAIAEREASPPAAMMPSAPSPGLSTLRLLNITTGLGVAAGLLTTQMTLPTVSSVAYGSVLAGFVYKGGLYMLSGGLALRESTASVGRFLVRNAGVWLGTAAGWCVAAGWVFRFGSVTTNPGLIIRVGLISAASGFVLTTSVGLVLIAARRLGRSSADDSRSSGSGSPTRWGAFKASVLAKVRRWINDPRLGLFVTRIRTSADSATT